MVEFGLTAPIYVLLLFGSIQMMFLPYQMAMSDKAVWEASRAVVTATTTDTGKKIEKMEKIVDQYKKIGFFGNQRVVRLTEWNSTEQVNLTIPHRLFFGLGVTLGASDAIGVQGGSIENYEGPLPDRGSPW